MFAPKHAWRDKIVVKPEIKKAKPCAVSVEADPYADSGQTKRHGLGLARSGPSFCRARLTLM